MRTKAIPATRRVTQSGMSLLETLVALSILLIASAGILAIAGVAMSTSEDQGHLAARASEYAQDKMEQLMSLAYCDQQTDTTQFPAVSSGGTGLGLECPTTGGTGTYGSDDPSNPVTGYVDYLDSSGNPLSSANGTPSNWYYIRVWQISNPSGKTDLKQITVTAMARSNVSGNGALPEATVTSLKSYPF